MQDENNDSSACNNGEDECVMDYSNEFITHEIFKSKELMIQWARDVGRKNGFVVVVHNTNKGGLRGRKPTVTLGCERGGKHKRRPTSSPERTNRKRKKSATKKCDCPFLLKGKKMSSKDDDWKLLVACGVHNHPLDEQLPWHSYAGKLTKEETTLVIEMAKRKVKPKDILNALKERDALNVSTMSNIYNAIHKHRAMERAGRSKLQHLTSKLSEHGYIEWHQNCDDSDTIKDLFWAHPIGIDLLHAFPHLLIMDGTCKTNRYHLPLLEIVGVTSTDMTFSVAFAYIEGEKEKNYVWALSRLKSLMDGFMLPDVIVMDRDLALMSAIEKIFPAVDHVLCRWNIENHISAKCKELMPKEMLEKFISDWRVLILSSSETEYLQNLRKLQMEFNIYPQVLQYVTSTWLDKYKERFVGAWTDNILHFGNVTTNRAEGAHAKLKQNLSSSEGSFESNWASIHELVELQHTDIKTSFQESLHVAQLKHIPFGFKELPGFISSFALKLVVAESKKLKAGVDASTCGCILRRIYGLPCAHEIEKYKALNRPIPLTIVHPQWKKLDFLPPIQNSDAQFVHEVDLFKKRFRESDAAGRIQLLKKLREIGDPDGSFITYPDSSSIEMLSADTEETSAESVLVVDE